MSGPGFTDRDLAQIGAMGMSISEIERQLSLFEDAPPPTQLIRPCTIGDGIVRLPEELLPRLVSSGERAAAAGRLSKFVPASGAASRMFPFLMPLLHPEANDEDLEARAAAGDREAVQALSFFTRLEEFPFFERLLSVAPLCGAPEASPRRRLTLALLTESGLGYAERPKALIHFHSYPDAPRTPFEEHLVEAAQTVLAKDRAGHVHFTISPSHASEFERRSAIIREELETRLAARLHVTFSYQEPSTDTLAVDPHDRPFRQDDGSLLFRPGGHGALLRNLEALAGDVVLIKNIDNILPDPAKESASRWKRILTGCLLAVEDEIRELLSILTSEEGRTRDVLERGLTFVTERLCVVPAYSLSSSKHGVVRDFLLDRLARPLRICGVVRNTGEPGGGPFWVFSGSGEASIQIVESAQIDMSSEEQRLIWNASTHFNPTDLVCSLRDQSGLPHRLADYVDPTTVFISKKTHEGRPLKALERPGLWNGAMARWNTVFVEVPTFTFAPVKSVLDLLRPEHRRGFRIEPV